MTDQNKTQQLPAAWALASDRLPLHKAFWNMPGQHNNNECYFPVRIDGLRYRVGEIFDNREAGAPDPIYYFFIDGKDYFEKDFHRIEWLDESGATEYASKLNVLDEHFKCLTISYDAALEKVLSLQARCDRYEKALNIAKHALEHSYDVLSYPATGETMQDKAIITINEALNGEGEKEKTFTVDQVDAMLMEFALMYHKNPHKDIANDAAEYLSDKLKEDKQ